MKYASFSLFALASAMCFNSAAFAQSGATDPVGYTTTTLPAESDSHVSVPFTRLPEFTGLIQGVAANVITISGTPGWAPNQFVYNAGVQAKRYYALIGHGGGANAKEGHTYLVTANAANTLTVDTTMDDLAGIT